MNYDFSARNVIVTGGTRGIGLAVCEAFLSNGANVTAIYRSDENAAGIAENKFSIFPFKTKKLDISDYSAVEYFFSEYNKNNKSLEVLVNNAGIRRDNAVGMMPAKDWDMVISSNLSGTFYMSKFALLKMMENRFGRIISITSPSGKAGFQGQANYSASKAGQVAFTKSLSKESARRNITVNCVSPGFIHTELLSDISEEQLSAYKNMIPLKRFGKPEEVASAVLFLSSREAAYITGTVLEVTGGL